MALSDGATLTLPAPAKVNYFLHVTGQREDGYHTLESLFVLIDLADTVSLTMRSDGAVVRGRAIDGVSADDDLAMRAAHALQRVAKRARGVEVSVVKRIPMGAGLGGGSSDAASVLLGLNRLWGLGFSRTQLAEIGLGLGADVPFFVGCDNAVARGIGEVLCPTSVPGTWLVLAVPAAHSATAVMFAARELTRSAASAKMDVFSEAYGRNDLEPVVRARIPAVGHAIDALRKFAPAARMTGSGACAFAAFASEPAARAALAALQRSAAGGTAGGLRNTRVLLVRTLARHPLASFAA